MVILSKKNLAKLVLEGLKTESRRRWRRLMVKEGGVYWASTSLRREDRFARLKVKYVRRQRLGEMSERDCIKEGCRSIEEFKEVWRKAYGSWNPDEEVYVVGFKLLNRHDLS